jgi:DNA-binding NarL/FixJ family response regulator
MLNPSVSHGDMLPGQADRLPGRDSEEPDAARRARRRPVADSPAQREEIRVLVADDDPLTRRTVCEELEAAGLTVVAQARDGREAVELSLELRPDIVLMDVVMPRCDGITATRELAHEAPEIRIVILSVIDDEELELLALRCGATGFLNKDFDLKALPRVVRGVEHGEAAIKRTLTRRLIDELRRVPEPAAASPAAGVSLSPREQEVLGMLLDGRSTVSIAQELDLALDTVRGYIKSLLRKLGVHSRREALELTRMQRTQETPGIPADIAAALRGYTS